MSSNIEGRELLDFIETLGELEWLKFESRYPSFTIKGVRTDEDRSKYPPYTSFRFAHENPEIIDGLRRAIDGYRGKVEWIMEGHQRDSFPGTTNWVICTKKMADLRRVALDSNLPVGQYMAIHNPDFGAVAYEDLLGLASHVREQLALFAKRV